MVKSRSTPPRGISHQSGAAGLNPRRYMDLGATAQDPCASPSHLSRSAPPPMKDHLAVIGGGIVGLATARALLHRLPDASLTLLEKEDALASHQTGRNSGVVHSGLYYAPGSLKARTCLAGKALLEAFAAEHGIAHETCGKVVVATSEDELPRLARLQERAELHRIPHTPLDGAALRAIEPRASGVAAIHVHSTGIIDYPGVCRALAAELEATGRAEIRTGARVVRIEGPDAPVVHLEDGDRLPATRAINCAGLHSDRVATASGARPDTRIVPFRGEYFTLTAEAEHLVKHLIYPVPDPRFPFLGVHFTRMATGGIECGPNAVFALAREGYRWRDISPRDLASSLSWPGTWRLFARHWLTGLGEMHRSARKAAFVKALQRLIPDVRAEHLERIPAGVRAQALRRDGTLLDDFAVERRGNVLHVINAPSPAATASFAIAEHIVDELLA